MGIDYSSIGRRIKEYRQEKQMPQERLADLVDLSKPHMSHIETGSTKVSLPTLTAIANALGCTLDDLVLDSLSASQKLYENAIGRELEDCTAEELRFLEELIKSVKDGLRRHITPQDKDR